MSTILVLSPHPDDESIGCGGTLRKHVGEGDAVHVVFLTSGEKGGHGLSEAKTIRVREAEARRAARVLGLAGVDFWHAPDGALSPTPALVKRLRSTVRTLRPARIYVPHEHEMHPDHRAAALLVKRATRERGVVRPLVAMFEVWTPLGRMSEIVDISPFVKRKLAAIRCYKSQCAVMSFDEAILGLNRYRGEMHSWPGGDYAEVFAYLE
jgi:N-acetylglucosamine malate deacetylase 1